MDTKALDRFTSYLTELIADELEVYQRNCFDKETLKANLSYLVNAKADETRRWETTICINDSKGEMQVIELNNGLPKYFIDSLISLIKAEIDYYEAENQAVEKKYGYHAQ